ncbi:hypothetical protein DNU06_02205 [Putridiphycobacter roseus]|uniref:Uncharacterized protein n=1 Tax=Putridiphycobacter roseus TaxID=2219161 RepID=A0A2W1NI08_9FLAO|nr:hypothetical protein [Putridiphycobacter roseus]PZE18663.1 hypothetical protein DNU06_02205 [Putridiphycobacter roseus]
MTTNMIAVLIEKEQIPELNFKKNLEIDQAPDLMQQLMHATRLGNIHHGKTRIEFLDDEGLKWVETTIWATGAKFICLKGGVWLPISRINGLKEL